MKTTIPNSLKWLGIAAILATAMPALARDEPESSPESTRAYREGYNLILNGDWDAATSAFSELLENYPDSGWADDAAFWRCYAGGQTGQPSDQIFACYEDHIKRYPRSEWNDDSERAMVRLAEKLDREGHSQYRNRVRDFGRDEDDRELMQVLVALGEIGDERSIDVILQRLDSVTDEHRRAQIVDVLEDIDSPRVVAKLESIIDNDPSELVRAYAVEAISQHDSANAAPILRRVALDTNQPARVRIEAIDELDDHRPVDMVELLKELATDPNSRIAEAAIDELSDIGTSEALAALSSLMALVPDVDNRRNIVHEIEDFESDAAVQSLLTIATGDPDPRIRRAATEALGDMDTAAAREALIQLLETMNEAER